MTTGAIYIPMGINPRTGRREYTEEQLVIQKPKWYRQWREYSDLDEDMIEVCVEKLHVGPFEWPGTKIAWGCGKGMNLKLKEVQHEWRGKVYTSGKLYREARRRLNAFARKTADARDIGDPFAFEYYLTRQQRKMRAYEAI